MSRVLVPLLVAGLLFGVVRASSVADDRQEGRALYSAKIRPVLVGECFKCHSSAVKTPKAGLRLDTRESLLNGGDSGPAIAPGKPGESLLIHVIEHASEIAQMPPGRRLPDPVIDDFRRWVKLGAPYDSPLSAPATLPVEIEGGSRHNQNTDPHAAFPVRRPPR